MRGFFSPVNRKGSRFPVWFLSPVYRQERFQVLCMVKEGFLSPVDKKVLQ